MFFLLEWFFVVVILRIEGVFFVCVFSKDFIFFFLESVSWGRGQGDAEEERERIPSRPRTGCRAQPGA